MGRTQLPKQLDDNRWTAPAEAGYGVSRKPSYQGRGARASSGTTRNVDQIPILYCVGKT